MWRGLAVSLFYCLLSLPSSSSLSVWQFSFSPRRNTVSENAAQSLLEVSVHGAGARRQSEAVEAGSPALCRRASPLSKGSLSRVPAPSVDFTSPLTFPCVCLGFHHDSLQTSGSN